MSELERSSEGGVARPGDAWDPIPDADSEGALSRLLDVVLDKGVYLDLELVITVAGVPLIAVNLRATIAGVETMLEWGVPGIWDDGAAAAGRAVEQGPASRRPPREPAAPAVVAELPAAMPEARAGSTVWRDGTLVLQGDGMVQWRGAGDRRPTVVLDRDDLDDVRIEADPSTADPVVVLVTGGATERLASPRAADVLALLAPPRRAERSTMDDEREP